GKYRQTAVTFCDVVDQLLDQYGFTHTGTTKQTNLTAFCIRLDQVNNLDTCIQYFRRGTQVFKFGWFGMNGTTVRLIGRWQSVNSIAGYIEQTAIDLVARRHGNSLTGVGDLHATYQTFGTIHGYRTYTVFSKVLLHFEHELVTVFAGQLKS